MPSLAPQADRAVARWLYALAAVILLLIVFGGFVRLTRSGLSIVEWKPIVGVLPPIGEEAWQAEFAKYQQTPEFQTVNHAMTLEGYRRIFYIEWAHRLIARMAGLFLLLPLGWFLWRGTIPWRKSGLFVGIAALFLLQGFLGWFMVASGLLDRPSVSHYRLTIHLLTAMLLFAITLWAALDRDGRAVSPRTRSASTPASRAAIVALALVVIQIAYGGLVAGLKAGHVSYTWPLMGGALMPSGLFAFGDSLWEAITAAPAAVHWIHRWFAFAVAAAVVWLFVAVRRTSASRAVQRASTVAVSLVMTQIALGVSVLLLHVPVSLALLHQAVGLGLFAVLIVVNHELRRVTVGG